MPPSLASRITRVGLGTWDRFDAGDDVARRDRLADAVKAFFAGGGNLIDSSPMYGSAERVVGDLLAASGTRDRAFLATKVWTSGKDEGIRQMNESMRFFRTDRIELMQIHNLVDWKTHLPTLRRWRDEGRIDYIGITHYEAGSHDAVLRVLKSEPVDAVQLNLSLDEPEAAPRVVAECAERGIAFIANRPFGGGRSIRRVLDKPIPAWCHEHHIYEWGQFMLAWVLSYPGVTAAIPGSGDAEHEAKNTALANAPRVDERTRAKMSALWSSL